MKTTLLWLVFFFVKAGFAQTGKLDPSFGLKGIVKTDIGSTFTYTANGRQVLLQPDSSMFLVIESAELAIVTKKHPDGSPRPLQSKKQVGESGEMGCSDVVRRHHRGGKFRR